MKAILTVEQMWLGWAACVLPQPCSALQRREMKRAFMAGAWIILEVQLELVGPSSVSEEEGAKRLENWFDQCESFAQALRQGKA